MLWLRIVGRSPIGAPLETLVSNTQLISARWANDASIAIASGQGQARLQMVLSLSASNSNPPRQAAGRYQLIFAAQFETPDD
jgi:hypothetical protein